MKFLMARVRGMLVRNPDRHYSKSYDETHTYEQKVVEVATAEELIEILDSYNQSRIVVCKIQKRNPNEDPRADYSLLFYDAYFM